MGRHRLFFGTYTKNASRGIYTAVLDRSTGVLGELEVAADAPNPTFLALSPDKNLLYAVCANDGLGVVIQGGAGRQAFTRPAGARRIRSHALPYLRRRDGYHRPRRELPPRPRRRHSAAFRRDVGDAPRRGPQRQGTPSDPPGNGPRPLGLFHARWPICHRVRPRPGPDLHLCLGPRGGGAVAGKAPLCRLGARRGPAPFRIRRPTASTPMPSTSSTARWCSTTSMPPMAAWRPARRVTVLPEGYSGEATAAEVQLHPNGRFLYGSGTRSGHDRGLRRRQRDRPALADRDRSLRRKGTPQLLALCPTATGSSAPTRIPTRSAAFGSIPIRGA